MGRRPPATDSRAAEKASTPSTNQAVVPLKKSERSDQLVELIDQCTAAKQIADTLGEKFLSYLLAMVIQEGRTAMRQSPRS